MNSASRSIFTPFFSVVMLCIVAPVYGMDNFEEEYLYNQGVQSSLEKQVKDLLVVRTNQASEKIRDIFEFQKSIKEEESVQETSIDEDNNKGIIESTESSMGGIGDEEPEVVEILEFQEVFAEEAVEESVYAEESQEYAEEGQELVASNPWLEVLCGTACVGLVAGIGYFFVAYSGGDSRQE